MDRILGEALFGALPKTPSFRLDGRRALVTGAGRGIGVACAAALAQAGAQVTLVSRSGDEIESVAAAIQSKGGAADCLRLDITDIGAMQAAVAVRPAYDVLVNNAGTNWPAHFLDVTVEDYDFVAALNVRASLFISQAVAKKLVSEGRGGSIIHMSSQMGHVGGVNRTVYCATKHALEGLTKAMAIDLGPRQIRVNTIGPTFIETPLTRPFLENADFRTSVLDKIKLGRMGQVEDLMGAVVFLASDASALITGTALKVDGGWTAE